MVAGLVYFPHFDNSLLGRERQLLMYRGVNPNCFFTCSHSHIDCPLKGKEIHL